LVKKEVEVQKIYEQHDENTKWMKDMLFFQDEMLVMQRRLAEVAGKNNDKDFLARLEHFQNQLIVQKNNIDNLKHEINIGNDAIAAEIKKNVTAIDHRSVKDHSELRSQVQNFEKVYNENKEELNRFLSKWM